MTPTQLTKENINLKTILIAEDDDVSYSLASELLNSNQVNVVRVKDGYKAITECRQNNNIDLVIMDIRLPIINGYRATNIIKLLKPSLPIIAFTACAMKHERARCFEVGCDDFIAKPVNITDFLTTVNRFLHSKPQMA